MTNTPLPFIRRAHALALVLCLMLWVEPARAQEIVAARPFSFGIGFGAAASPGLGIGSSGLGTLGFHTPWRDTDFRLDGSLTTWSGNNSGRRLSTVTANLVYSPVKGLIAPYVIGGLGGYAEPGRGLSVGANVGVGAKASFGRFRPFVELREHMWSSDRTRRLTPVTIGISF
jgi:hypothetical protein